MFIEDLLIFYCMYFACYCSDIECLLKVYWLFTCLLKVYWLLYPCISHIIEPILNVYWRFIDSLLNVYGISLPQYWMFIGAASITQVRMKDPLGLVSYSIRFPYGWCTWGLKYSASLLHVYFVYIACLFCVYCMYTVCNKACLLCVYCMSTVCILHVYCLYMAGQFGVYCLSVVCVLLVETQVNCCSFGVDCLSFYFYGTELPTTFRIFIHLLWCNTLRLMVACINNDIWHCNDVIHLKGHVQIPIHICSLNIPIKCSLVNKHVNVMDELAVQFEKHPYENIVYLH